MRRVAAPIARLFSERIHAALVCRRSGLGEQDQGCRPMSVSSISAAPPIAPIKSPDPKPVQAQPDNDANDASKVQPATPAPLPPGQGTRVDQLRLGFAPLRGTTRRKLAGKYRNHGLSSAGEDHARHPDLYRRLPLRPGAFRMHHAIWRW